MARSAGGKNLLQEAITSFAKSRKLVREDEAAKELVAQIGDTPVMPGQPATANIPGVGQVGLGGSKKIQESAQAHAESQGRQYLPQKEYAQLDPKLGEETAEAYAAMKHDPTNPEVHRAYQDLADETVAMYERMMSDGVETYFIGAKDPYAQSPYLALLDISQNKRLGVFPTETGFGSDATFDPTGNPLLQPSGFFIDGKPALINDLFRAIHDYYGHAARGVGFRAGGERNAFLEHFASLGPLARRAAATETHGQNSSLNFGPNGSINRTAIGSDTLYENQKAGLMSNDIIMRDTELQSVRQRAIESVLRGDDRGLEAVLGKDGSLELVHYSRKPHEVLDPKFQGTGLGGKTIAEKNRSFDTRYPERISLGVPGSYKREQGLGQIENKVRIRAAQMYDLINDPDNLKASIPKKEYGSPQELATLLERAVKENGYSGFFIKNPVVGVVAQIFDPIKTVGKKIVTVMVPLGGGALVTLGSLAASREADASLLNLTQTGIKGLVKTPMSTAGRKFTNQDLIAMGYLTDATIAKHAGNPKAMRKYIDGRESQLIKDLKESPGLGRRYDLMKANGMEDVIVPLDRGETKVWSPDVLEGKVGMGTMSDLSDTVKVLQAAGIPTEGIDITGGFGFMALIENIEKEYGWAAAQAALKSMSNRAQRASEKAFGGKGAESVIIPLTMRQEAVSFTAPMSAMFMEQIRQIGLPKEVKNLFDRIYRDKYPQWVGLDDPRAYDQIIGKKIDGLDKIPGTGRTAFNKLIGAGAMQKLGFPSYQNAVRVLSREGFEDIPEGVGQKIFVPKEGGATKNVIYAMGNDTYDSRILIDDWAKMQEMVPAQILFPDLYKKISKRYTNNRYTTGPNKGKIKISKETGKPIKKRLLNHHEIIDVINKGKDSWQEFTPEVVDGIHQYLRKEASKQTGSAQVKLLGLISSLLGSASMIAVSDDAEASGFASLLTQAVKNLPMKKGAPDQMVNMLKKQKGISKKELDMIDWDQFDHKKSITKEELGEFVEAERPKINVVEQMDVEPSYAKSQAMDLWYNNRHHNISGEALTPADWIDQMHIDDRVVMHSKLERYLMNTGRMSPEQAVKYIKSQNTEDFNVPPAMMDEIKEGVVENNPAWLEENWPDWTPDMGSDGMDGGMRYKDYSLAGGENYREIYFNLEQPKETGYRAFSGKSQYKKDFNTKEEAEAYALDHVKKLSAETGEDRTDEQLSKLANEFVSERKPKADIYSGHMSEQPNNMAWARVTEHTGPNGEKVLQINEIQSDARGNEKLKKLLPKEWRENVLNAVMKQAQDEGFDGVTWAKDAKQVDEIEKWGMIEAAKPVKKNRVISSDGKVVESHVGDVHNPTDDFRSIDGAIKSTKENISYFERELKYNKRKVEQLKESGGNDTGQANNVEYYEDAINERKKDLAKFEDYKAKGYKIKQESVDGGEDIFTGGEGLQRVIDQYTKEMPQYAKQITGQDVGTLNVDGKDLNFVPLTEKTEGMGDAVGMSKYLSSRSWNSVDEAKQNVRRIIERDNETNAAAGLKTSDPDEVISKLDFVEKGAGKVGVSRLSGKTKVDIPDPVFFGKPTRAAAAVVGVGGAGTASADPQFVDRINNPQNYPFIQNDDGSKSTHRMAAEVDENGNWFVFPTIVQKPDGTLHEFNNNHEAMRYNQQIGNVLPFESKEEALAYAEGGYKTPEFLAGEAAAPNVIAPSQEPVAGEPTEPKPMTLGQQMFPESTPEMDALSETLKTAEGKAENLTQAAERFADLSIKDKQIQMQTNPQAAAQDTSLFNQMFNDPDGVGQYIEEMTGVPVNETAKTIHEFFTGEKAIARLPEDVRDLPEFGAGMLQTNTGDLAADLRTALGFAATFDQEERKAILEFNYPGVQVIPHGDVYEIRMPDGRRSIMNVPGASNSDWSTIASELLAYSPAGRVMAASAKAGAPWALRAAEGFGVGALTDVAQQSVAKGAGAANVINEDGTQGYDVDLERSGMVGGFTGVFPLGKPIAAGLSSIFAKGQGAYIDPIEKAYKDAGVAPQQEVR